MEGILDTTRTSAAHNELDTGTATSFLDQVIAVIDEHIADESLSVNDLSRYLAVSRSLLYLRLRELTDRSPTQLIFERRLVCAAALLAEGDGTVSEVAYRVGFKSVSHFSQRFRERFLTTPSDFLAGTG